MQHWLPYKPHQYQTPGTFCPVSEKPFSLCPELSPYLARGDRYKTHDSSFMLHLSFNEDVIASNLIPCDFA